MGWADLPAPSVALKCLAQSMRGIPFFAAHRKGETWRLNPGPLTGFRQDPVTHNQGHRNDGPSLVLGIDKKEATPVAARRNEVEPAQPHCDSELDQRIYSLI
jgi:hypothetical protein